MNDACKMSWREQQRASRAGAAFSDMEASFFRFRRIFDDDPDRRRQTAIAATPMPIGEFDV